MDRRERQFDPEETLRLALEAHQTSIWTSLPGIIQSFDPEAQTCVVQPAIKGRIFGPDGTYRSINMPLLLDCPVVWQGGGGCTLTFPIKPGDECLVSFSSRCIDGWWQSGGVQEQAEFRMHNLSDGFVLAGVRSQPRKFAVSTDAAQLRTDDGAAYIEINPTTKNIKALTPSDIEAQAGGNIAAQAGGDIDATSGGSITMTAASQIVLNAPNVIINGALTQGKGGNGGACEMQGPLSVVNDVVAGGKSLKTHVHSGVTAGGANTGQPV